MLSRVRIGCWGLGLGYFDDVDPDETLPAPRQQIVDRPFCAIPRPTGRPEIAEEERPGVTPWPASYVIESCPRKNGGGRPRERGP